MRRSLPFLAVVAALAACSGNPAPDAATPPPAAKPTAAPASAGAQPAGGATKLTIYSGDYESLSADTVAGVGMPGYALVERALHYSLQAGMNSVSANGMPAAMDVEAAQLLPRTDGVTLQSQRFIAPLSGTDQVIAHVIGQRIVVEHTAGTAKQSDTGVLLAANDGLTLALGDGRIKVIRDYDNFSVVDGSKLVPQQAELRWTVQADSAGDADFLLSYPMGGMAWRAEYRATLADANADAPDCRLAMDGAAMVVNRAGVGFTNARLSLVAGEPSRARGGPPEMAMRNSYAVADASSAKMESMPSVRQSGEYHAYELPQALTIANGVIERVPLFAQLPAVACERAYTVGQEVDAWIPPRPLVEPTHRGQTGTLPVTATVSVRNAAESGLGKPLPAGRVRVFDGDDFLGESMLSHTPAGADITLEVGKPFDLRAEREATDFRLDRAGRTITESFAITLSNAKDTPATIEVIESLPRWSDWDIVESSVKAVKKGANRVEFAVLVPAKGETVLTYTVRYRWTEGDKP